MFRIPAVAKFLGLLCVLRSALVLRHNHLASISHLIRTTEVSSSPVAKEKSKADDTYNVTKVVEEDFRAGNALSPRPENATTSGNSRAVTLGAKQKLHLRARDRKVSNQIDSPLDFQIENLNLSIPATCGVQKCFYKEKGENPRFGYLVQQEWPERDLAIGKRAWNFAKRVEKEYDVLTLFGPVQLVRLSEKDASKMNSNLIKESQQRKIEEGYYEKGKAVAFAMKIAPQPSLLLGVSENKIKHALSHLKDVIAASSDKASFLINLKWDVKKALALIEEEPCLVHDFQVLLDSTGRLYHIDFDRCYDWSESKKRAVKDADNSEDRAYYREKINEWVKPNFDLYIRTADKIIFQRSS